jgi:RNA polymerase sigma-70 factor, ECF subfamily
VAGEPADDLHGDHSPEVLELDPELGIALRSLSALDREALLLVAWEDLTPTQAARSLGISPVAFRVRLLRARRRIRSKLETAGERADATSDLDLGTT